MVSSNTLALEVTGGRDAGHFSLLAMPTLQTTTAQGVCTQAHPVPSKMSLMVRFPMASVISKRIAVMPVPMVRFENKVFTISFVSMNVGKHRLATMSEGQQHSVKY